MRILGFSKKWPKFHLNKPVEERGIFTTFRFPRRDRDWMVEELVQVVFKPRRKGGGEFLGIARIIRKQPKDLIKDFSYSQPNSLDIITPEEAYDDGFSGMHGGGDTRKMRQYFYDTYGYSKCEKELINKLILYWIIKDGNGN